MLPHPLLSTLLAQGLHLGFTRQWHADQRANFSGGSSYPPSPFGTACGEQGQQDTCRGRNHLKLRAQGILSTFSWETPTLRPDPEPLRHPEPPNQPPELRQPQGNDGQEQQGAERRQELGGVAGGTGGRGSSAREAEDAFAAPQKSPVPCLWVFWRQGSQDLGTPAQLESIAASESLQGMAHSGAACFLGCDMP